jgi:precorrin-3B methylase
MSTPTPIKGSLPFDIGIVGLGIVAAHQITREAEEILRRSRHTLLADPSFGVLAHLEAICPKVTSLNSLYELGKSRLPTYRRMAKAVINAALTESPVCFATYGHPLVLCYPTALIQRAATLLNLRVEIYPGVSSLDTLLVDLGVHIGVDGLQMYEATDLLLYRRQIQPDVPCILWQAHVVGNPTCNATPRAVEEFLPLQDYLLEFYPPKHSITLVVSKTFPLLPSLTESYPLQTLAERLSTGPQLGNLYIPALRGSPIKDFDLLRRLTPAEEKDS